MTRLMNDPHPSDIARAKSSIDYLKRELAKKAIGTGFSESVHFVFQDKEKLLKYGFQTLQEELELLNPITRELNTLLAA